MPKVLVLGAGLMGPAIASDLIEFGIADQVVLTDFDPARLDDGLRRVTDTVGTSRVQGQVLDLRDRRALVEAMRQVDVVAGAYPVALVREVTEAALEAGTHLCDLTGSAEGFDVFAYDAPARAAGVTILPGCGLAPGLTNILGGQGASRLAPPLEGVLYVGGLPARPLPPLEYRVVFSIDTVLDEYVAPVLIVQGGRTATVPALDGLEELTFPEPVGRCEAFWTYGLGTLAVTGPGMGFVDLSEKTVRYPGHRDKVRLLRECGLLAQEPVNVDGAAVVPRRFTAEVLTPILQRGDEADVSVLRVVVLNHRGDQPAGWQRGSQGGPERGPEGGLNGERASGWVFEMVDHFDRERRVTSMARTTGYTCSIIVGLLLRGSITARGVAPLEQVFADARLYTELRQEMARRNMIIHERPLG